METLLIAILVLVIANIYLSYQLYKRGSGDRFQLLQSSLDGLDSNLSRTETSIRDEFTRSREETNRNSKDMREELTGSFSILGDSILNRMAQMAEMQKGQLKSFEEQFRTSVNDFNELQRQKFDTLADRQADMTRNTEERLERMREVLEAKLKSIQDDNNEKLEKMRATVDEKLHKTLEDRLGESFKIVSERLESVHRGLGEMQSLAAGVGDLKKVLSNVKTRGTLGEYQLGSILEQILAPEQYSMNVVTKAGSREQVEFAVKLPGRDDREKAVWLPLDSKFHMEKYHSLLDAYDKGIPDLIEEATKELDKSIKSAARDIREKYLDPPNTTDFGIMFLPFEGLYAEVVRRPELLESIHREFRVSITGPSTLAAFLNSLQMGFRTLAIEKRTSEVWALLGAVKTDFGRFGEFLDGVHKNLEAASNKIMKASSKSRMIEKKLKDVQALPTEDAVRYLGDAPELEDEQGLDEPSSPPDGKPLR